MVRRGRRRHPRRSPGQGRGAQSTAANLLDRLEDFADAMLAFLWDVRVPFTNHQAEQDIRMIKVRQPPSYIFSGLGAPVIRPGFNYQYDQYEVHDLEISPLLLGWHRQHFDLAAGYAFWVPTDGNSFNGAGNNQFNPSAYAPPAQYHWWEHMITLGGIWYLDAGHKWAVSDLNHYEINQSFDSPIGTTKCGQLFTTEWGISRTAGKYFTLGVIGNYSRQITATRNVNDLYAYTFYSPQDVEIGPEVKVTVPKYDFSASLRYLRELNNPNGSTGSFDLNVIALTLSKRF